jgi:threonine dehydratase
MPDHNQEPTIESIRRAADRIRPYIHRTPVLTCGALDRMCQAEIFFKCENFQKAGVFKIRGAANAVFCLSEQEAARGVATHSSGNHAAAVALAARLRGIQAYTVMPETAPQVKKDAVSGYGAKIFYCRPTLPAREARLDEVVAQTGAVVIHPFNDYRVIEGQATSALELLEEVPGLDVVMAPVGGGGLISGTALSVSALSPASRVIAAEPERADDAFRSFREGRIVPMIDPDTIADGLLTSLGDKTFAIIRRLVSDVLTVSEEGIITAMQAVWERMKIVIEPSSAVPLGVLMTQRDHIPGRRIGIILSGGNVDSANLPWSKPRAGIDSSP